MVKDFEDLVVWQKAHAMVLEIYRVTESFPRAELFTPDQPGSAVCCLDPDQHSRRAGASDQGRVLEPTIRCPRVTA